MDPTTLALMGFALNVGGSIFNHNAQAKAARINAMEARSAESRQINDVNLRAIQEHEAAAQQMDMAQRQTTTALSSARLSAGEAGVTGASVDALLNTVGADGARAAQDISLNETNTLQQLDRQKAGISAEADSRVNSVQPNNPLALALKIAGAGIGLGTQLQSRQAPSAGNVVAPNVGPSMQSFISATPAGTISPSFRIRPRNGK